MEYEEFIDYKEKTMKLSENARTVLERRYLKKDQDGKCERVVDMFARVAEAVSIGNDEHRDAFFDIMTEMEFLPNSPTLMNAGRELGQLSACFVLPVGDSMPEIFESVKNTAMIHKSGGGTGFSFSRLRPANDTVQSTQGISSGHISFMRVFDVATETIKQGGTRRGANMGMLRIDHPDIMDFIMCKDDQKKFNNFNISVAVTDDFMKHLRNKTEYALINPRTGKEVGRLDANKVWNRIIKQAWKNGEPGIVFIDQINKTNPTPHSGNIEATNPCGEQPLLPYEACNLGSINLSKFVDEGAINWGRLEYVTRLAVRFLDNVITINKYPIPEIEQVVKRNRKIGLGVMGWADMLIQLDVRYGSSESYSIADQVMSYINRLAHEESEKLGEELGSFPAFEESKLYQDHAFMRNSTVTTIAPTGTISIIASASSGIEPLFAISYVRNVMDNDKLVEVNPYFEAMAHRFGFYSKELMESIAKTGSVAHAEGVPESIKETFVTAHDTSPEQHVRMQATFQRHIDNAVSKTVNFSNTATVDDVQQVYELAYELGCKGITIYRDGSRDMQVLSTGNSGKEDDQDESTVAPIKESRPKRLTGYTYQYLTGCGQFYITINEKNGKPFELFATIGKAGGCAASQAQAIGRMVSLAWRSGVDCKQVIKQLQGISCHRPAGFGPNKVMSCADAISKSIIDYCAESRPSTTPTNIQKIVLNSGACPECGGIIEREGGCSVCRVCGHSECA